MARGRESSDKHEGSPESPHFSRADVRVGLTLLVFCGVAYFLTTQFAEAPAMLSQNVPPTFFPRLVLGILAALSLGLIVSGWNGSTHVGAKIHSRVYVTAALFAIAIILAPRLGTLSTVFLVSIVLPICWGERRKLRIAAFAIALPLAIHILFALALGMRFPTGLLG